VILKDIPQGWATEFMNVRDFIFSQR